jgi:hypothetical protein
MAQAHPQSDARALEADADCARLALACVYSSSEEYEAELIETRRRAGVYGPSHQRQVMLAVAAAAAVIGVFVAAAFVG